MPFLIPKGVPKKVLTTASFVSTHKAFPLICSVIPVVWHIFTTTHNVSNEEEALRSPPSYYDDSDSQEFRLDMSKFQDDVSLNEFVNKELHRILPGVEMDEKFSVFLSSDISEKMMKLYHDESLNIFKTKVDEYDIHKNILKEKYNKGKSILLFK